MPSLASICVVLVLVLGLVASILACTPKEPVEVGASCSSVQKTEACAIGNKAVLCRGGTWPEWATCRGPTGCTRYFVGHGSTAIHCDGAHGRAGGLCRDERMVRCSEDGASRLVCHGGRWSVQAPCAGGCSEEGRGKEVYLLCRAAPGGPGQDVKIE
jgi:hypothetical protein